MDRMLNIKRKLRKADRILEEFISECFTPKGKYQDKKHAKVVSPLCKWCAFNNNKELCDKS